jgi:hypothetical protein
MTQLSADRCAVVTSSGQDQDLPGDPVVRAEQRPERGAGVAELYGEPHLLVHGQAEAAVLGGQGVTVQAHLLGLLDQPGGNLVGLVDAGFGGHHLAPDERAQQVEQLVEFGLGHHERDPNLRGRAAEGPAGSGPLSSGCPVPARGSAISCRARGPVASPAGRGRPGSSTMIRARTSRSTWPERPGSTG